MAYKKLRAALIGMSHVHVHNLTRDFQRYPERLEIIGIADVPPYTDEEREMRIKFNVPECLGLKI